MIYQNDKNENTQNQFSNALKELQIGKLLRNSNITKSCGISAYEVFQFLLLLVFQGRNLFRFLNSTNGYKFRKENMMSKTDAAVLLIQRALQSGIKADYLLMDTWFTTEPMIRSVMDAGLDVIGMVKHLKQRYTYKGKKYTLHEPKRMVRFEGARNIFGSLVVTTKTVIPVKIVFVRNRNKKSECLYLSSTDVSLSDTEIVRIYGNRWSIECFFRSSKSFLKLGTEFQNHNYGAMVSHMTIVFTRYIILEWIRRNQNDQKTYGELFFMFCDDIQDMDLTSALQSLMALFVEHILTLSADITSIIKCKIR